MLLIVKARQWPEIVLLNAVANRASIGTDFALIGKMRSVDPHDAPMDMLIEEGEHDAPRLMWATHSFSEDQVELFMKESGCAVISDTAALAPEGVSKEQLFSLSGYGWAARFLQHQVRDRDVMPLTQAIRRITSLPASRLGLRDRGALKVGNWADVTVFDAAQVESRFSVREPRTHPGGIAHVMVHGELAMRDGQRSDANSGRVAA